jgi:hypothetical protein
LGLSSICVPSFVEDLSESCFAGCSRLSSVTFESDSALWLIGNYAFSRTPQLLHICFPPALRQLEALALAGSNFDEISIADGNCDLKASGPFILDFDGLTVTNFFGRADTVTIPANIEAIGPRCFAHCQTLRTVVFEAGSTCSRIGDSAFSACSLSSICIPCSVEEIGENCFSHCQWLSRVTFESGSKLSCVPRYAFSQCVSLASIAIPSSVCQICDHAFDWCLALRRVTFNSDSQLALVEPFAFEQCASLRVSNQWMPSCLREMLRNAEREMSNIELRAFLG